MKVWGSDLAYSPASVQVHTWMRIGKAIKCVVGIHNMTQDGIRERSIYISQGFEFTTTSRPFIYCKTSVVNIPLLDRTFSILMKVWGSDLAYSPASVQVHTWMRIGKAIKSVVGIHDPGWDAREVHLHQSAADNDKGSSSPRPRSHL